MKKRTVVLLLVLVVAVCLCLILLPRLGTKRPAQTVQGEPWDENWAMLGSVLGVEDPGNGFVLLDNNSILTAQDTYLATWVSGDPIDYVTADGDDAQIYEAEIFLLLQGCKDSENAALAIDEWTALAKDMYAVSDTSAETHQGQQYTVLTYTVDAETNPYDRGVSAYAVFENYAVSAELTCLDSYAGDIAAILADFLDGCHYAGAES